LFRRFPEFPETPERTLEGTGGPERERDDTGGIGKDRESPYTFLVADKHDKLCIVRIYGVQLT